MIEKDEIKPEITLDELSKISGVSKEEIMTMLVEAEMEKIDKEEKMVRRVTRVSMVRRERWVFRDFLDNRVLKVLLEHRVRREVRVS